MKGRAQKKLEKGTMEKVKLQKVNFFFFFRVLGFSEQ
jgi:hypothetical protein